MDTQKEIAGILLDIGAVKVSMDPPFTWASGIKSPVYCDNRKLISYPKERKVVIKAFAEMLRASGINPEYIGGTATAAIPWASFLAYEMDLPMIYIRPEKKEHGAGKQVEGFLPAGKRVLILEDLISTGGSSVNAAQAVQKECQGVVSDIFAIVTWEIEEGKKTFADAGLKLTTLTNFSSIIGLALERGVITKEEWDKILEFKKDPRAWGAKL
ncbi:MAG: orotate phosphoribosyltransferase [Candidatus Gracilibacteria bacterium]